MRIAACQLPEVHCNLAHAISLIDSHAADAQRQGAKLVCFPECFLQGYSVDSEHVTRSALELKSASFERILRRLEGLEPVIVLGLIEQQAGKFYNTAVVIERGTLVTRYRKAHLTTGERAVFDAGTEYPVFELGGVKVGINICRDLRFAASVESCVRAGAQLLVCPCNNMLRPEAAEGWKYRHNELRCKRARDSCVWLLSSDVTGQRDGRVSYGPTALIDSTGSVVAQVPLMTTGIVVAEFAPR